MLLYFNKEVSSAWLLEEDILLGKKKKYLLINVVHPKFAAYENWNKKTLPRASPVAQLVKNLSAVWKTWVWSLGWDDPLEEGKAILWPGESYGLYSPWGRKEWDTTERPSLSLSGCDACRPLGCRLTSLMSTCYIFSCCSL